MNFVITNKPQILGARVYAYEVVTTVGLFLVVDTGADFAWGQVRDLIGRTGVVQGSTRRTRSISSVVGNLSIDTDILGPGIGIAAKFNASTGVWMPLRGFR